MSVSTNQPESGTPPATPAPSDGSDGNDGTGTSPADEDKSGFSPGGWEIIAGVVLLVSALVIIIVLTGDDGDGDASSPQATFSQNSGDQNPGPNPSGQTPGGGDQQPTVPSLPEGMPETVVDTTEIASDNFDRSNSPDVMGEAGPGQVWVSDSGVWGIDDDQAYVSGSVETLHTNRAVLTGIEMNQGTIEADLTKLATGAGILFRYQGPFNYFTITPVREFVGWRVQKVVNGKRELVGFIDYMPVRDDMTVTVQLQQRRIEIYLDGQPAASFTDGDLIFASGVGLTVSGADAGTPRFDNFVVGQIGDGSIPGLGELPEGDGSGG
jgi:hypothetical protein